MAYSSGSGRQQRRGAGGAASSAAAVVLMVAMSLALLLMPLPAQAVEQKGRPFSRLQATTGNVAGSAAAETEETVAGAAAAAATITTNAATTLATKIGAGAGTGTLAGARARKERLRPSEKVAFLQNVMRKGGEVDPMQLLQMGADSKGFQVLLKNVEIQHKILEEMPLLAAFNGFKQARGRRLSDEDTKTSFAEGVQNVLNFAKNAFGKIKDPTKTAETIAKMAADPDPTMQALFRKAKEGDKDAVFELQDRFNDIHFPGVDARVLREVAAGHNFDKLLSMPEVMRFVDRDETLSKLFRDPDFMKNGKEFFKAGNGVGSGATATVTGMATGTMGGPGAGAFVDAFKAATGTAIGGEAATAGEAADGEQQP